MKKILLAISLFLVLSAPCWAQMSVSCSLSSVSVQVKRCFAQGDDVLVDLIVTGTGRVQKMYFSHYSEAYDDEGNKYYVSVINAPFYIQFECDNRTGLSGFWLDVPKDVPRKVRMRMLGADEYASSFPLIKIPCDGDDSTHGVITIKNLPINK